MAGNWCREGSEVLFNKEHKKFKPHSSLLAKCNDRGNQQQESRIRVQVISFGRLSATRVVALESRGTISVESVFCCVDCRVHMLFLLISAVHGPLAE